jgi:hypothetical protein
VTVRPSRSTSEADDVQFPMRQEDGTWRLAIGPVRRGPKPR